MTRDRKRGYCARCHHQQIFEKSRIHHGVHFFLSVVTCGLWMVSWLSIYIGHRFRPWRCLQCGWHKPQFEVSTPAEDATKPGEADGKTAGAPVRAG